MGCAHPRLKPPSLVKVLTVILLMMMMHMLAPDVVVDSTARPHRNLTK